MKYNFDEIVAKKDTRIAKYDERMKKFGREDVIPLWIADMDFKTAQPVIDALVSKAKEGIFGYTSRTDRYFKAGNEWKKRRNNWEIDEKLCSFAVGVIPAMTVMGRLWCEENKNKNILIQPPIYGEFAQVVKKSGNNILENRIVKKDGKWQIDWEDFEEKIKDASMFLFCNPHNPMGIVWEREEIERIVDLCYENNVMMISDEIHSDLVFHNKEFTPAATVSDKAREIVITCYSASKTFNLAGLQVATIVFPNIKLKNEFDEWWHSIEVHRNNSFSSVAMEVAFDEGEEWLEQLLVYLSDNFDFVVDYCNKYIPEIKTYAPDATYLMWFDCKGLNLTDDELEKFMLEEAKLGLLGGRGFDSQLSGYMRMNVACPRSVLKQALDQLRDAIKRRK